MYKRQIKQNPELCSIYKQAQQYKKAVRALEKALTNKKHAFGPKANKDALKALQEAQEKADEARRNLLEKSIKLFEIQEAQKRSDRLR